MLGFLLVLRYLQEAVLGSLLVYGISKRLCWYSSWFHSISKRLCWDSSWFYGISKRLCWDPSWFFRVSPRGCAGIPPGFTVSRRAVLVFLLVLRYLQEAVLVFLLVLLYLQEAVLVFSSGFTVSPWGCAGISFWFYSISMRCFAWISLGSTILPRCLGYPGKLGIILVYYRFLSGCVGILTFLRYPGGWFSILRIFYSSSLLASERVGRRRTQSRKISVCIQL